MKRNSITRPAAAQVLSQVLCYAFKYSTMAPEKLARRYCEYKKRVGHAFYYPDVLKKRYDQSDQLAVLKQEFEGWFGLSPAKIGGRVTRLALMAPGWSSDARLVLEQVRSVGIQRSIGLLKQYATGRTSSRWINEVIGRAEQMERFREVEWTLATFLEPGKWVSEEPIGRAA